MSAVNQLPYATSSEVSYRVCVSLQAGLFHLEDLDSRSDGQVKDEYPKFGGAVGQLANLFVPALLGYPAPNVLSSLLQNLLEMHLPQDAMDPFTGMRVTSHPCLSGILSLTTAGSIQSK